MKTLLLIPDYFQNYFIAKYLVLLFWYNNGNKGAVIKWTNRVSSTYERLIILGRYCKVMR